MRTTKIRCTYSYKWRLSFKFSKYRYTERKGYILGFSRCGTCYTIKWDGKKATDSIHISFIQPIIEQTKS